MPRHEKRRGLPRPPEKPPHGMGWIPDRPDHRDHNPYDRDIPGLRGHKYLGPAGGYGKGGKPKPAPAPSPTPSPPPPPTPTPVPAAVDWRQFCTPVEDQGQLGSCTANAAAGLLEYCENRAFQQYKDGSRLFVYKLARQLAGLVGDSGAYLRDTMKVMADWGVPTEPLWPYNIAQFDVVPPQSVYDEALFYQSLEYFRYDIAGITQAEIHNTLKAGIAGGLAAMFGVTTYTSFPYSTATGDIPIPQGEAVRGGHAMLVVGYDDNHQNLPSGQGAYAFKNSWGPSWGAGGFGWLPYWFIQNGIMRDLWSLVRTEYVNTPLFVR